MFEFNVLTGSAIKTLLSDQLTRSIRCVKETYLAHHDGMTVNPDSYFLRFPNEEANRIIALPAAIQGKKGIETDPGVSGIKWIASYPKNVSDGIPRASAVLILNNMDTGYPFALLECSQISAVRTAASAVLGAFWLNDEKRVARSIAFIGAGVIARNILDMFIADAWSFETIEVYDTDAQSMSSFVKHGKQNASNNVAAALDITKALQADIVVFATNAGKPYVLNPTTFGAGQIILNISLRDLGPELILAAQNFFDDVDHCMKANTSPHLAEQMVGSRYFVTGTLAQLIRGEISLSRATPLIYSPFGMGVLDLALGKELLEEALSRGLTTSISNFFGETIRW